MAGSDGGISGLLDMSYELRTILRSGRHFRSAIKLYMGFGMRQQTVELGLKVDAPLAQELAQGSVELEEWKRLWLMIAKNAASEGVNSADADVVAKVVSVCSRIMVPTFCRLKMCFPSCTLCRYLISAEYLSHI